MRKPICPEYGKHGRPPSERRGETPSHTTRILGGYGATSRRRERGAGNPSKRSGRIPCTPASVSSVERHVSPMRRSSRPTPRQDLRKSVAVEGSRSLYWLPDDW